MDEHKPDQNLVRIVDACQLIAQTYGIKKETTDDADTPVYTYTDKQLSLCYTESPYSKEMDVTFRNKPLAQLTFCEIAECMDYVMPLYARLAGN